MLNFYDKENQHVAHILCSLSFFPVVKIDVIIKDYMNGEEAVMVALDGPLLSYGAQGVASGKGIWDPLFNIFMCCYGIFFTAFIYASFLFLLEQRKEP